MQLASPSLIIMTVPSYISLEKGDEAASKFSEKKQQLNARVEGKAEAFDRIKVELPSSSPRFLQL